MNIQLRGEEIILLPERALFLPRLQTLYITDLHWGKAATFRSHAIPLPEGAVTSDLERLSAMLIKTQAQRLVMLGDLIHARAGWTAELIQQIEVWRQKHPALDVVLVRGNHDRHAGDPPAAWGWQVVDEPYPDPPFILRHQPAASADGYVLAGHLHPAVQISGRGKQLLRLPCFVLGAQIGILPAFGSFTGTALIQPQPDQQIFVIAGQGILPLPR